MLPPVSPEKTTTSHKALPSETYIPRAMPRILGTWDMSAVFMLSIYLTTCATTAAAAGPAAITYFLLAVAVFFVPCLIATAQLGKMYPFEGALYNWTHRAMGGYWSFFSGFCAWFPCVLIQCSLANLLVSYIQSLFSVSLTEPWQHGLSISIILLLAGITACCRFRTVQNIVNVIACLLLISTCLIGTAGFLWWQTKQPVASAFGSWSAWNINIENFAMFGLLVFAFIGAEVPLNLAGELKSQKPIKRHLLIGGGLLFVMYLINTMVVLVVQGPAAADNNLAMVAIVETILGKPIAYITAIGLMSSLFATILIFNYLYARLLLVASIDHRLPKMIGKLNKNRVPANAIGFQVGLAIIFSLLIFVGAPMIAFNQPPKDFAKVVYSVSQAAASLVWTVSVIFLFIDVIACSIRDPQRFRKHLVVPKSVIWISTLLGLTSCVLTILDTLFFSWTTLIPNHRWWYLVGSLTLIFLIISAFSSMLARSEAAWEEMQETLIDSKKNKVVRP